MLLLLGRFLAEPLLFFIYISRVDRQGLNVCKVHSQFSAQDNHDNPLLEKIRSCFSRYITLSELLILKLCTIIKLDLNREEFSLMDFVFAGKKSMTQGRKEGFV